MCVRLLALPLMPLTKKFDLQCFRKDAVIGEVPLHVNVGGTRVRVNINLTLAGVGGFLMYDFFCGGLSFS